MRKIRVDTAASFGFRPLWHGWLSRWRCRDDYENSCRPDVRYIIWKWTLSTMLELAEIIAVWSWREVKKKNKTRRRMWIHPIISVAGETAGYFGLFLKIWGETKGVFFFLIILECMRHVELCETVWMLCTKKQKKDTNLRKSVPPRDGSAVAHI